MNIRFQTAPLLVVVLLGLALPAQAAQVPPPDVAGAKFRHEAARGLAEKALQEADSDRRAELLDQAIGLWREAEALHPTWRYAYNLARAWIERGAWLDAWGACRRARALDVPRDAGRDLDRLERTARKALLKERALVRLIVEPPDAWAELNGDGWKPPRERWVDRGESELTVRRRGHVTHSQTWKHPIGRETVLQIRLSPQTQESVVVTEPARPLRFGSWKSGLLIGGLVGFAGGAGLLVYREVLAQDQEDLNADVATTSDYMSRYEENESRHGLVKGFGIAFTVLGAAAAIGGGVLYFLEGDPEPESAALIQVRPLVLRDGAGLAVGGGF